MTTTEYLYTPRTHLEKKYLNGNISFSEFERQRSQEIQMEVFKDFDNQLTFNPLRMPYKYLKKFIIRLIISVAILSFAIGQAIAQPIVIYDSGKTIDAQQFYPFQKPKAEDLNIPPYQKQTFKQFPVVSSKIKPGKIKSRIVKSKLPRAICIVGSSKISKKWIKHNRDKLTKINALCVVVNVGSKKVFKSIKSIAPNVEFQALNGDVFARQFNIYNYPALIHNGIVVQ